MDKKDLQNRFTYHPADGMQPGMYGAIRSGCLTLAHLMNGLCPEGREKALAIRKLEEAMFWANAAIARNYEKSVENGAVVPPVSGMVD